MMNKKIRNGILTSLCLTLAWSSFSYAGQISYSLGVDADYVKQEVTTELDDAKFNVDNQVLAPYFLANYTGPKLLAQGRVVNNLIRRQLQEDTVTENYVEYDYSGQYQVIDTLLSINASGSQRYLSERIESFDVDDFLLNSDNLGKAKNNSVGANVNIPRGDFFGLNLFSRYRESSFEFERESDNNINRFFDNESLNLGFNALSGTDLTNIRLSLGGNVTNIKRSERQDFDSQSLTASIDINLISNFALAINGFYENNEIQALNSDEEIDSLNEFYSAGLGLIYQLGQERYFEVAYNRSKSEGRRGLGDEENDFISLELAWALTERTNVQGTYTRRFFGDAGSFSFNHRLRNWRSSIRYNESVTSQSQLINTTTPGLVICDDGVIDISECILSDSPSDQIGDGQFTVPIQIAGVGVNDRIVIRKNLVAQTLVNRRRTTFSLTGSHARSEEVEVDRLLENSTVRTKLTFNISPKSLVEFRHTFSKIETDTAGELGEQLSNEYNLELRRRLTGDFSASITASYLNRNGEANIFENQFRGLDGPLTDRRVTFRISYRFANGRFQ